MFSLTAISPGFAASVQLKWAANSEPDLAGYKVYHNVSSAPLSGIPPLDVSTRTTATISGLDPTQSYSFAISAYNSSGLESSLSGILHIAELIPPAVAITSPADNASVSGTVSVSVTAADNVGVTKVEFYVNGVLKNSDTATPYIYSWDTSLLGAGLYTLMVKAYDAAGNVSQSNRSVTVVNDYNAPSVSLTAPLNSATLSGIVTVKATARDNVSVNMVEFYINGSLRYASNLAPYSFNWDTRGGGNGTYTLMAIAYDNAAHSAQSSAVTVTVINPLSDITNLTVADALLALQIGSGKVVPTPDQLNRLDVAPVIQGYPAPDGNIDTGDAIVILAKVVGKPAL